jgi:hypothetical protein
MQLPWKPKPPEPKGKPSDPGWYEASLAEFEWHELQQLNNQYDNFDEIPELKTVKSLLKKLKNIDLLEKYQSYAYDLISDFNKPDECVISELEEFI